MKEFLDSHLQLKINKLEQSKAIVDRDLVPAMKAWKLNGLSRYGDHQFNPTLPKGKASLYGLELSKDFAWGMELTFGNSFLDAESKSFQQSLTLSQELGKNLFGKRFYLAIERANQEIHVGKIVLSQQNQRALGNFYRDYLSTRLQQTLLALQNQALQRSKKRLEVTRKRVRDGLNERADLYSAQIEYLRMQEELASVQFSLQNRLGRLSESLHRQVQAREIDRVSLGVRNLTKSVDYNIQDNLKVRRLKGQLQKLRLELDNLQRQYIPGVTLSGTYRTNDVNEDSSAAFENGRLGSDQNEYVVTLELKMPLDFTQERLKESRKKIEIRSLEMNLKKTLEELNFQQKSLQKEIAMLLKNLQFSVRRIGLSKKNLRENTRLYGIGKINFDRLIRAEENLINTERSYVNNWFQHELAVAKKVSLYAKLLETVSSNNL